MEPILKKYVNGDSIRQYAFIFTSRDPYGVDVLQNIDNSEFYEKIADWIESQNDNEIFPLLDNRLEPLEIKVTSFCSNRRYCTYSDIMNMLDTFLLGDRITQEQYEELVKMMNDRKEL